MVRATDADDVSETFASIVAALQASGDVVYEWDMATDQLRWYGCVSRLFPGDEGYAVPKSGQVLKERIHADDEPQRGRCLNDHLSVGAIYDCEFRLVTAPGLSQWVHDRGAVLAGYNGANPRFVGTMRLVNARHDGDARLQYLANHDELTGCFNKKRLQECLDDVLRAVLHGKTAPEKSAPKRANGAFAVLGVDQLAMINTAYGYEAGDAVLVEVARRLAGCLRGSDVIGRVGGDRFGVMLTSCNGDAAQRVTERAVELVHQAPVATPCGPVRITVTAGIVTFPAQSSESADIITKAEGALRETKIQGRNRIGFYELTEAQRAAYRETLDIGAEVEDAVQEDRLMFAYQPIYHADSLTPHSHECLLRMRRRDGEIVSAGRFVPAIEKLGLMRALERQVLQVAVNELAKTDAPPLAINISGLTASDPAWLRELVSLIEGRPDIAQRLIIEITETAALQDITESARFVSAVRELGVRVALDDFGAGFTNFQHLKALTVDIVKIDGAFVRNIDKDSQNRLFVRNLISLASSLGVMCVAECVETRAEADALIEEGAGLLQGYYYSPPILKPAWHMNDSDMPSNSGFRGATQG